MLRSRHKRLPNVGRLGGDDVPMESPHPPRDLPHVAILRVFEARTWLCGPSQKHSLTCYSRPVPRRLLSPLRDFFHINILTSPHLIRPHLHIRQRPTMSRYSKRSMLAAALPLLGAGVGAVPCVQFDASWGLYAFGGSEDVKLGTSDSWGCTSIHLHSP